MISNINYVNEVLKDLRAKKKYGQNFLIDENICENIARIAVEVPLTTIEIGPGLGALTEKLLKYASRIDAYEIDKDMYELLTNNLSDDRLNVYLEDFLKTDLSKYTERINICGNLPYYVTSPILFKIMEADLDVEKITIMIQKEVADRIQAKCNSSEYGSLSLQIQYLYDVRYEMNVSKNVFYPKPNVDSAVISLTPKINRKYNSALFDLIRDCFRMRRKTLRNNLKDVYADFLIDSIYKELEIDDNIRPQELTLEMYIKMYEIIGKEI